MAVDTFINLYDLLQVPSTADVETIRDALKMQRKTWQKRQNAADPAKRAQAEEKMRRLDDANRLLLDPISRTSYDEQLANYRPPTRAGGDSGDSPTGWLERARDFLTQGDAHSAAYAAKQATELDGGSHAAWAVRAEASLHLSDQNAALFELGEALRIKPDEAEYHFDLGMVYESIGKWAQALAAYEQAARLDPSTTLYQVAVATIYLQQDQPKRALEIMERVVAREEGNRYFNLCYALALHDTAIDQMTLLKSGLHVITTEEQANKAIELLSRANLLVFDDADLRHQIETTLETADASLVKKVSMPPPGPTILIVTVMVIVGYVFETSTFRYGLLAPVYSIESNLPEPVLEVIWRFHLNALIPMLVVLVGGVWIFGRSPTYKVTDRKTKATQVKR